MRVVLDGIPLLARRAGIGHYTYHLLRALARVGPEHRYVAFCPRPANLLAAMGAPRFTEPNVRVTGQGWAACVAARLLRRLGRPQAVETFVGAFDVYHATNNTFPCRVRSAARVVTIHDMTLLLFPEWHPRDRLAEMAGELEPAAATADRIIAPSVATRNDVVKLLGVDPDRVTVIPEAAGESFRPAERSMVEPVLSRLGLAYRGYLLFLGTIEPRKNLLRLFQALEAAGGHVGPLAVAGDDGWNNQGIRREMARLEASGRVRCLGYVPDEVRPALMNGARAFVYPSLYEGFGLPVLEALACGTPVITADCASLPEITGDAALLVNPCDVAALAGAIARVWDDAELRRELGVRGLRQAAKFSWERTARMTLDVYRAVRRA